MRGVSRLALRMAGGPQSTGRKGPCAGGVRLRSVLSNVARRLELTYALALYQQFDRGRTDDDMLMDPDAILYAWRAFIEAQPDHEINILHFWTAVRAVMQRQMSLVRCAGCSVVQVQHTMAGCDDSRGATANECFICTERRRERTQRTRVRRSRVKADDEGNEIPGDGAIPSGNVTPIRWAFEKKAGSSKTSASLHDETQYRRAP